MAEKKVDEAALRRTLDAIAVSWQGVRSKYGPHVLQGPAGTRLHQGLADMRRRLSRMLDSVADEARRINKSSFSYTPHLGSVPPPTGVMPPLKAGAVYVDVDLAGQLLSALNQAPAAFGQQRSSLNSLFAAAGGPAPPTSALQQAAQRCGELAGDLRLRLEYVRAAGTISVLGQGAGQRTIQIPDWRTAAEAQTALNQARAAAAARAASESQGDGKDDGGLFGKAFGKARRWGGEYAKGVYSGAGELGEAVWNASIGKTVSIAIDPKAWWDGEVKSNWRTVDYAWHHKTDFVKQYAKDQWNWDEWRKNPVRASGRTVIDVVAAIAFRRFTEPKIQAPRPAAGIHASGGRRRPRDVLDQAAQKKWAQDAYTDFKSGNRDIDAITSHLRNSAKAGDYSFTRDEIAQIKAHLFERTHPIEDYDTGRIVYRRYDPDEHIASAWIRLRSGRALPQDSLLLRHELAELSYRVKHPGSTYREAHQHANREFNWEDSDLPNQIEDIDTDW